MRFGEFDVDPDAGELRRNGVRVKLQDLPFRLLVVLLRRPGAVVAREELRAELWGAETFVDAEAGLNTAIGKLREALGDNAEQPTFIETLPKRGYRFIGMLVQEPSADLKVRPTYRQSVSRSRLLLIAGLSAVVVALAGYAAWSASRRVTMAVVRFHNETGVVANDQLAGTLTDAVVVSLAQQPRYGVVGNSPLLRTDRIFQDVRRIGTALNADYVILGQLQNGDAGLVVRAHFIRVSDQSHLWAGKVDLAGATDPERAVTTAVADGVGLGLRRR